MSIGIAILGAGIFATEAHLPAIASLGNSAPALRAVYSRSEKSATELAKAAQSTLQTSIPPDVYHDGSASTNLDALLSRTDIAAVIVVLPITLQPDVILKALAAGKHVLSEKPVAPDVAGGISLIQEYLTTYQSKGLIWRVAENFEVEPAIIAAGKAIRDGKIGKVAFFNMTTVNFVDKSSKWYRTPWRTIPDYQGGFLLDGGVHSLAALRVILPSSLANVVSYASLNKDYLAPHDTINAIVKCDDGSHGIFELTYAAPTPTRTTNNSTIITGSHGWLSIGNAQVEDSNGEKKNVIRVTIKTVESNEDGEVVKEKEQIIDEPSIGVEAELRSFIAALDGTDDGAGNPRNALKDVAFIEAALTSQGQAIDLQKLVDF